jgi:hypothetical protein
MTKPTSAADRHDTWDANWEERLSAHVRTAGAAGMWDYVRQRPKQTYRELSELLAESGRFGVAPVQIERLQVRDTPEPDLKQSIRDSLVRHIRHTFRSEGWGRGAYWESLAIGALGSWSAMWLPRADLGALRTRLFELEPPEGWLPEDERDSFLLKLVPDAPAA